MLSYWSISNRACVVWMWIGRGEKALARTKYNVKYEWGCKVSLVPKAFSPQRLSLAVLMLGEGLVNQSQWYDVPGRVEERHIPSVQL